MSFGTNEELLWPLAVLCRCKIGKLSLHYLGILLGVNLRKVATWEPTVEKFKKRLGGWKCRTLSFTAIVVLINLVLLALPIYFMSLFQALTTVINSIDRIRRQFLWGCSNNKKMERVCWDKVCLSKKLEGIGVVNLKVKNRTFMVKCSWRFVTEKNALWRKVIKSKYGSSTQNWRFKMSKPKKMTVVWCGIVENSKSKEMLKWICPDSFKWVIGNTKSVLFWEYVWYKNRPLKVEFSRLYILATIKNSLVKDVATNNSFEEVPWEKVFSRKLLDREICMVDKLKTMVGTFELNADVEDRILWIHDNGGSSQLKSYHTCWPVMVLA